MLHCFQLPIGPHAFLYRFARPGAKYVLDNVRRLMAELGDPQATTRWIHVGGTNGKGSVAAMLASVLSSCGLRVGLFTSPHIVDLRERIAVDGRPIEMRDLETRVADLDRAIHALERRGMAPPSFFEAVFATAALHFAKAGVDVGVAEVGLGGRLDATNVISPLVTIITNVGHDHRETLGPTLSDVAREKAGIVKPGVPVVSGAEGLSGSVIEGISAERGAALVKLSSYTIDVHATEPGSTRFSLRGPGLSLADLAIPLAGRHQAWNVSLTVLALRQVQELWPDPGCLRHGLAGTRWQGRFDVRRGEPTIVLDAAHNPEAIESLAATLDSCFPGRRPVVVFGVSRDKEIDPMIATLGRLAEVLVFTRSSSQRAAEPGWLMARAAEARRARVVVEPDPRRALAVARARAGPAGLVVATGSIFLLGDLWASLQEDGRPVKEPDPWRGRGAR